MARVSFCQPFRHPTRRQAKPPDGDPLSYSWTVIAQPTGSNPAFDSGAEDPTVIFDMAGAYTFRLTISDGTASSSVDHTVVVTQSPQGIVITP